MSWCWLVWKTEKQVYSYGLTRFHKQMPFDHHSSSTRWSVKLERCFQQRFRPFDKDHVFRSSCLFFPEKKNVSKQKDIELMSWELFLGFELQFLGHNGSHIAEHPLSMWGSRGRLGVVNEGGVWCATCQENVLLNDCRNTNLSQPSAFPCGQSCKLCLAAIVIAVEFIPSLSLPVRWMLFIQLIAMETQVISPQARSVLRARFSLKCPGVFSEEKGCC